ncbi:deleted in malignant brain tumors 1 protein-like isoform X2 [Polypterus senegalus]|uniref:deleted in malignant brain tumors 1 protein-like isoform X2 n=1 Tax=Polypterus senegalus TaxID=55291 RepID=UPI00196230D8|nr:deleted in malignant brain tumors 1 protein-like isoform X2 [Polypterus senegalus]
MRVTFLLWTVSSLPFQCTFFDIRFENGSSCEGRVEVFYNDTWGTVCSDGWNLKVAEMFCLENDCGFALAAPVNATYGNGTGPVWIFDLYCPSDEQSLEYCSLKGFKRSNCSHDQNAGIICSGSKFFDLKDGSDRCSGKVVFHDNDTAAVCSDHWELTDAQVLCRQRNCGYAVAITSTEVISRWNFSIILINADCIGTENNVLFCPGINNAKKTCKEEKQAGVICSEAAVDIRLVNGSNHCSGRLEMYYKNQWGMVCDNEWDLSDAHVVCRQLRCGYAVSAPGNAHFGEGDGPFWLDEVYCTGHERSLVLCGSKGLRKYDCHYTKNAGVICSDANIPISLLGGSNRCSGTVQLHYNNIPGGVTMSMLQYTKLPTANVICKQMNCGHGVSAMPGARFGQNPGQVWINHLECDGDEPSVAFCKSNGLGVDNHERREDFAVICSDSERHIRLVKGSDKCSGSLELNYTNQWEAICHEYWTMTEANVVCRELGCGYAIEAPINFSFGDVSHSFWYGEVWCTGNEPSLLGCNFKTKKDHWCNSGQNVGAVCSDHEISIRLVNGSDRCSGRVELFYKDHWGTVCDDEWDLNDAHVVCRQLGCGYAVSAPGEAHFGEGSGVIWMDQAYCRGNESSLVLCAHHGLGKHDCHPEEDAGVICSGSY